MKSNKIRADIFLTEKGLAPSREKAKAYIMAGVVYNGEIRIDKPGELISPDTVLNVREKDRYVSRGGLKLEKSMTCFPIDLKGKVCMDIGASTGGFTDCMLKNGAKKVYAVDVGYGQLAWQLRNDERVCNLERTNIRYLDNSLIKEQIEFISIDVSFISLKLVLPKAAELLQNGGSLVALIKPQFEAGREKVGKKGVVRDPSVHAEVIENVMEYAENNGFSVPGIDFSPVKGPEGNIEYLAYMKKTDSAAVYPDSSEIKRLVELSHREL